MRRLLPIAFAALLAGCATKIDAPTAMIAAAPASVAVGTMVQLDGTGSTDPQKKTLAYAWSFTQLPAGSAATLGAAETARPYFVADVPGTFEVKLIVSNAVLTSAPATVSVVVGTCGTNPPVVTEIATDPMAPHAGEPVALSATVTDADVDAPCGMTRSFSYAWSLTRLPAGSHSEMAAATTLAPWFEPDVDGTYQVSLVVQDQLGHASAATTLDVAVGACGTHVPVVSAITPSAAAPNAGQVVGLTATISDADADPPCGLARTYSYAWTLSQAPAGSHAAISLASTPSPWFQPDVGGTYAVTAVVSDELGRSSAPLTQTLTVGLCGAAPPVVQEIAPSTPSPAIGQVVQLQATVSDADAAPPCGLTQSFSYDWRIEAAPAGSHAQLNLPTASDPSFTVDQAGPYVVGVTVTDSTGRASAPATFTLNASACGGSAPVVAAVTPSPASPGVGGIVQLTPTVTDADTGAPCAMVESFSYAWTLAGLPAGSAAFLNNPAAQAPSFVPDVPGDYQFALVVTDGEGHPSRPQTFIVTASACGAAAPSVDAIVASPPAPNTGQAVQLSATVTDADNGGTCNAGQSFTYAWTLMSAPLGSQAALHLQGTAQPWFTPDVPGTYAIGLVTTDSTGRSSPLQILSLPASTCGSAAPVALVSELAPDVVASGASITGPSLALASLVQLSAAGSTDADNGPGCNQKQTLSYRWSFLSIPAGSAASLNNATVVAPSFRADVAGAYVVGLVVTDSTGLTSAIASATVTADPAFGVGVPAGFTISTLASGGVISAPRGLTEDGNGNIYVVQGNSRITRLAAGTNQLSTLTTGGFLAGPSDVAFDAADNELFVTAGGNRIIKVALNGTQTACTSLFGAASFRGIEVYNGTGGLRVVAADRNNGQLDFFTPATCALASFNNLGGNTFRLWGVAAATIGGADDLFVTDESFDELWRNIGGAYANNAGAETLISFDNVINIPRDVVVTPSACANRKLITANAGSGELLLFANGPGATPVIIVSGLTRPVGLFVESRSSLLITDETGNAVFRLAGDLCSL